VSTIALDPAAVRRRFSALDRTLAFFDGPARRRSCDTHTSHALELWILHDRRSAASLIYTMSTAFRRERSNGEARR
jgi:hypothetical protein